MRKKIRTDIVAVWADNEFDDIPAHATIFSAAVIANFRFMNEVGDYPMPTSYYGVTCDGTLVPLEVEYHTDEYDARDLATVTITFRCKDDGAAYAGSSYYRDGRA